MYISKFKIITMKRSVQVLLLAVMLLLICSADISTAEEKGFAFRGIRFWMSKDQVSEAVGGKVDTIKGREFELFLSHKIMIAGVECKVRFQFLQNRLYRIVCSFYDPRDNPDYNRLTMYTDYIKVRKYLFRRFGKTDFDDLKDIDDKEYSVSRRNFDRAFRTGQADFSTTWKKDDVMVIHSFSNGLELISHSVIFVGVPYSRSAFRDLY